MNHDGASGLTAVRASRFGHFDILYRLKAVLAPSTRFTLDRQNQVAFQQNLPTLFPTCVFSHRLSKLFGRVVGREGKVQNGWPCFMTQTSIMALIGRSVQVIGKSVVDDGRSAGDGQTME